MRDQENFWIIVRRELSGGRIEERSYRLEQQDYGGVTFDDGQEVNLFNLPKNGRMLVLPGYGEYEREIFTLTIPFYYEK